MLVIIYNESLHSTALSVVNADAHYVRDSRSEAGSGRGTCGMAAGWLFLSTAAPESTPSV